MKPRTDDLCNTRNNYNTDVKLIHSPIASSLDSFYHCFEVLYLSRDTNDYPCGCHDNVFLYCHLKLTESLEGGGILVKPRLKN